jgi:hypothetical protein
MMMLTTIESYHRGLREGQEIALNALNETLNIECSDLGQAIFHVTVLARNYERLLKNTDKQNQASL